MSAFMEIIDCIINFTVIIRMFHQIYGLKFFENTCFNIYKNTITKTNHQNAPPFSLTSRIACNGENGRNGEKSPASDNLSWMPNVAPWRLAILAKLAILGKIARGLAKMTKNVLAPRRYRQNHLNFTLKHQQILFLGSI